MSLGSVFNRGLDGLTVNQRALSVAANNIANMNTKGYARQQVIIGAKQLVPGDFANGGGAEIVSLNDVTNPFIEMQLFTTENTFGTLEGRRQTITQLEGLFNEATEDGLGKNMSQFFSALNDLAQNPNSMPSRQNVKDRGTVLAERFNKMAAQINSMRQSLSSEITTRLETINSYTAQIAKLNESILNAGGADQALDLVAQRRLLLRELSSEMDVSYYEESNGAVSVQTASGATLVERVNAATLDVSSDNTGPGGKIAVRLTFPKTTNSIDITDSINGGKLGGNLIDRNTTLNNELTKLDTLAYQLVTEFNAIYSTGYGLDGTTGNNFFVALGSATGAANSVKIDASVSDVRTIAAAQQAPAISGVGDNRIALALAALQNSKLMSTNTETFSSYYTSMVSSLGVTSSSILREYDTQANLLNQIETQRESVSGVNMDEEGADIIRYQRAFQASQKIMQIADQLLEDLLRI